MEMEWAAADKEYMDINSDNININNMPTKFFDDENIQFRSLDGRNRTPGYWGLLQVIQIIIHNQTVDSYDCRYSNYKTVHSRGNTLVYTLWAPD